MVNPLVNRKYVDRQTPINADWLNGINDLQDTTGGTGGHLSFIYSIGYVTGTIGKWLKDLALAAGSTFIGWVQAGVGALTRTVSDKLRDTVSVTDFVGCDPTGATDSTTAFTNAQNAADCINIPPGTYLLTNFRHKNGKQFVCAGPKTILKQGDPAQPIWNMTSDASTGQLIDIGLLGRPTMQGAAGSACELLRMRADTPYVIQNADVDVRCIGGFHSIKMYVTAANEIYASRIKVTQTSSISTGCILGGVYNQYWMHIAGAANGVSFTDVGWNSVFTQAVSEGQQVVAGQNATLINPTIESWVGTAQACAMNYVGANPTIINANLVNVPAAKAPIGLALNGGGGGPFNLLGFRIIGATDWPTYPMDIPAGNTGIISSAKIAGGIPLEAYVSDAILQGITFNGDCSTLTGKGKIKRQGVSADRGDASVTLVPGTDQDVQRFATALTANRTITLSTTGAVNGDRFRIVRTGLGAFTLDVGGLKTLPAATASWAEVEYNGAAWVLVGYGLL